MSSSTRPCLNCLASYAPSLLNEESLCVACIKQLPRVHCYYCFKDFRLLAVNSSLPRSSQLCPRCVDDRGLFGEPRVCDYCKQTAAFEGTICHRCKSSEKRFHCSPEPCEECGVRAAFRKPSELSDKVDGKLLCYCCTLKFKLARGRQRESSTTRNKDREAEEERERKRRKNSASAVSTSSHGHGDGAAASEEVARLKAANAQLQAELAALTKTVDERLKSQQDEFFSRLIADKASGESAKRAAEEAKRDSELKVREKEVIISQLRGEVEQLKLFLKAAREEIRAEMRKEYGK